MTGEQMPLELTRARRTDPATSHAAAAAAGELARHHAAAILGALVQAGERGLTIHEAAGVTGIDHVAVARRLPELERRGVVRATELTRLSPSRRAARVWVVA